MQSSSRKNRVVLDTSLKATSGHEKKEDNMMKWQNYPVTINKKKMEVEVTKQGATAHG
jgi:hypothetical protein